MIPMGLEPAIAVFFDYREINDEIVLIQALTAKGEKNHVIVAMEGATLTLIAFYQAVSGRDFHQFGFDLIHLDDGSIVSGRVKISPVIFKPKLICPLTDLLENVSIMPFIILRHCS